MEAGGGGAKVTALPTDDCQNILALMHKNPTQRAKSKESNHTKKSCDQSHNEVSPPSFLRSISLGLGAFSGISPSHEQPRAAGKGAGPWADPTLQRPTGKLVKAVKSFCSENKTSLTSAPRLSVRHRQPGEDHLLQHQWRNSPGDKRLHKAPVGTGDPSNRGVCDMGNR